MWKKLLSLSLLALCLLSFGKGIYLWCKAELAQVLLLNAWEQSITQGHAVKPWPWADIYPEALLTVPRLKVEEVVLGDQHGEALAFGPGMVKTNDAIVLAGHRDSHFEFLRELKIDDMIYLQTANAANRAYRIVEFQVVNSATQSHFLPAPNTLVLVTCYPFDDLGNSSPLRLVSVAEPLATQQVASF